MRFGNLSRVRAVGLGLGALGLVLLGFAPQFAGPGYEAALAAGLFLPSVAGVVAALEVSSATLVSIDVSFISLALIFPAWVAIVSILILRAHPDSWAATA
jgi:hypothetical protein